MDNESIIVIVAVGILFGGFALFGVLGSWRKVQVEKNGVVGSAVVKRIKETGRIKTHVPEVVIDLYVTLPGYPPYTIEKYVFLPMLYYPRVQPGMTVEVIVDPAQRDNDKYLGLRFHDGI